MEISDYYIKQHLPGWPFSPAHLEHQRAILTALKNKDLEQAKKALVIRLNSVEKDFNNYFYEKHASLKGGIT